MFIQGITEMWSRAEYHGMRFGCVAYRTFQLAMRINEGDKLPAGLPAKGDIHPAYSDLIVASVLPEWHDGPSGSHSGPPLVRWANTVRVMYWTPFVLSIEPLGDRMTEVKLRGYGLLNAMDNPLGLCCLTA